MAGRRQWVSLPPPAASGDASAAADPPGAAAATHSAPVAAATPACRELEEPALYDLVLQGDIDGIEDYLQTLRKREGDIRVNQEILSCDHGSGRNAKSPLHFAATRGFAEVLRALLAARVDANSTDDTGNTPLHFAADLGHARAARILLESGADAEASNNFGRTPADNAKSQSWDSEKIGTGKNWIRRMFAGTFDPVEQLPAEDRPTASRRRQSAPASSSSAQPGAQDSEKRKAPADPATSARGARPQLLTLIGDKLSSVFNTDWSWPTSGKPSDTVAPGSASTMTTAPGTPVTPATPEGQSQQSLRTLIKRDDLRGIDAWLRRVYVEALGDEATRRAKVVRAVTTCEEGDEDTRIAQSGVHLAALLGKVTVLKTLLATRASPNVINDQGSTPLHLAVDLGRHEAVQILMQAKANPKIRNNFGRCPDEVREGRNSQVVPLDHLINNSTNPGPMSELLRCNSAALGSTTVSAVYAPRERRPSQNSQGATEEYCNICRDVFQKGEQLRILPCFHRYHAACVDRWLMQSRTCPTCKHDIDVVDVGTDSI